MPDLPIHQAQQDLQALIKEVTESHQPIRITGSQGNAVLLSEADWSNIQETLYLLSVPGMRDSIREGLATPVEDCSEALDW
jgi:prevent-host-death family protein